MDLKIFMVFELTTEAGSLFYWITTLTWKYDLRAFALHLRTFNFMPLALVIVAL